MGRNCHRGVRLPGSCAMLARALLFVTWRHGLSRALIRTSLKENQLITHGDQKQTPRSSLRFAQGKLSPRLAHGSGRLGMTILEDFGGTDESVPFPFLLSRFVSVVPPGLTRFQAYPGLTPWAVIFRPFGAAQGVGCRAWRARAPAPHDLSPVFAPPPKARLANPAQSDSSYRPHRRRRKPGRRSSRNKFRTRPKSRRP
jgi:hypothetical protein